MATTELSLMATPGKPHTFSPKDDPLTEPGRFEYTIPKGIMDYTINKSLMDFTLPKSQDDRTVQPQ